MRIIVFSDSHGAYHRVREVLDKNKQNTEMALFLGDGLEDLEGIESEYPGITFYKVKGNCDFGRKEVPKEKELTIQGKKILMTHGDLFGVKYSMDLLEEEAVKRNLDIILYGHTHVAKIDYQNERYYINPGSLLYGRYEGPSYLRIDFTEAGVIPILVKIED